MSKIIVTGGNGFIGGHLVDELVALGHYVIVIDDLSADDGNFHFNPFSFNYKYDITEYADFEWLFEGVDYVFHLAAEARIQASIDNPRRATLVNVFGTTNVLQASRKYGVKRVIYSSTSAIYGLECNLPTDERQPNACLNPYSSTKLCGEEMVKCFSKLYGLDACIFRYFNVYGERSPVSGPYSLVTGIFLDQKKKGEPLTVVGDGSNKRDFVHVSDVVNVNLAAMEFPSKLNATIFNIGSGENFAILDVAAMISPDNISFIPPREGEAKNTLCQNSRARLMFGWKPKIFFEEWIKTQL